VNESGFIATVTKKLPAEVYAWKINARFAPGVPDCWYSGPNGDLWVEWKLLPKMLTRHKPKLSKKQLEWLSDRYDQGRQVAVMVGSPQGTMIYLNKDWTSQQKVDRLYSRQEIADWITSMV